MEEAITYHQIWTSLAISFFVLWCVLAAWDLAGGDGD